MRLVLGLVALLAVGAVLFRFHHGRAPDVVKIGECAAVTSVVASFSDELTPITQAQPSSLPDAGAQFRAVADVEAGAADRIVNLHVDDPVLQRFVHDYAALLRYSVATTRDAASQVDTLTAKDVVTDDSVYRAAMAQLADARRHIDAFTVRERELVDVVNAHCDAP